MAFAQSTLPALSAAELDVLDYLERRWPTPATVASSIFAPNADDAAKHIFIETVQRLSDNGFILYEAYLVSASSGTRFIDAMITARGRAALRQCNVSV